MSADVESTDPDEIRAWLGELEGETVLVKVNDAELHGRLKFVGPIEAPLGALPVGALEYAVGDRADGFYFHPDELDHAERIPAGVILRLRDGKMPITVARSSA